MGEDYGTRWLTSGMSQEVLGIESTLMVPAWDADDWSDLMSLPNSFGKVAVSLKDNRVVGYIAWITQQRRLEVVRMAVARPFRRQGVGTLLLMDLAMKLSNNRRPYLRIDVPEICLDMQLFLRHHGIRCTDVIEDGETLYRFRHRVPQEMTVEE